MRIAPARPARPLTLLAAMTVLCLGLATACSGGVREGAGEEAIAPAVQTYQVRGQVIGLPEAGREAITIRHEPIPEFVGFDGEVEGMESMAMPFPLGDGLDPSGIESGDKVRFTLEVEWEDDDLPYRITRIERLPAETALDWGG